MALKCPTNSSCLFQTLYTRKLSALEFFIVLLIFIFIAFFILKWVRFERPSRAPAIHNPARQRSAPYTAETGRVFEQVETVVGRAYVIDGDSIVIQKTQIRLFGIDAPELKHPYGKKAKWALLNLCKGQEIRAKILTQDAHGRTVAHCFLGDGRDLSAEMVKQGLAIDWPKFSGGIYRELEVPDARQKMWLADARQKGRMHVWENFEQTKVSEGE